MRLSDVLSKNPSEYQQVERFMNSRLACGKQRKLENTGDVLLNYFCQNCNDMRTFSSNNSLCAIGVDDRHISVDCALKCVGCKENVTTWFLLESEENIFDAAPNVRILKKAQRYSDMVKSGPTMYEYSDLLEKAEIAYQNGLGAGAIVYLRKVFELVTASSADVVGISKVKPNGRRKTFSDLLKEVDAVSHIIPREFSNNGYGLYQSLSKVIHGEYDEEVALRDYAAMKRLVVGVIENITRNEELAQAVAALGIGTEGTEV